MIFTVRIVQSEHDTFITVYNIHESLISKNVRFFEPLKAIRESFFGRYLRIIAFVENARILQGSLTTIFDGIEP